jgi:ABC-2 type transport system ATP-binding protein
MSSGDDLIIETHELRMSYGPTEVLHGIDLYVGRGETLALLGPNGAGKTTTLEILEGFRKRSAGAVSVLGTDPEHGDEAWRARLGIVLQSWRDHGRWRVRELLDYLGSFYRPYTRPYDAAELIGLVGLTAQADHRIGTLSGGQRRRLDVAVGLVGNPDLLFLDEPTVGFDPEARQAFHALLADLPGTTILLTTHDLDEAERLSDRIVILAAGEIVAEGNAEELAKRFSARAEVRFRRGGEQHLHECEDATAFVRDLFGRYGEEITDLEVRRPSLQDVYLTMVREQEAA